MAFARTTFEEAAIFRRLLVLLDHLAPDQGAFVHALEWAVRLQLPLHVVSLQKRFQQRARLGRGGCQPTDTSAARPSTPSDGSPVVGAGDAEGADAYTRACGRRGVPVEVSGWEDAPMAPGACELLRPADLLVFSHALPPVLKRTVLRQLLRSPGVGMLICPETWTPLSRVLLLNPDRSPSGSFLGVAGELCRCFQARSVVLTVARSERVAQEQEQAARRALVASGLQADFDRFIGAEVRTAVTRVACWRRCQLVILERPEAPAWWRWLRSDPLEQFLHWTRSLTFLALPEAGVPDLLSARVDATPASREPSPAQVVPLGKRGGERGIRGGLTGVPGKRE